MEVDPGSVAGTAVDRFLDEPLARGLNGETAVDRFLDEPSDRGPVVIVMHNHRGCPCNCVVVIIKHIHRGISRIIAWLKISASGQYFSNRPQATILLNA